MVRHRAQGPPSRRWFGTIAVVSIGIASVAIASIALARNAGDAVVDAADVSTSAYVPVGPLRLADTREQPCGCTAVDPSTVRVDVTGRPEIDDDAIAAVVTVTALTTSDAGFVTAFPAGTPRPDTSTVNTRHDRVVANTAIVPLGADGGIDVFSLVPGHIVVDVTGVFVPAERARSGRFVATTPARLVDTREPGASTGELGASGTLTVPLPPSAGADTTAIAVNVTSIADTQPGFLVAQPAGAPTASTSFLNYNGTGQAVASAVIVPTSPEGFTITTSGGGHVVVDLLGWFTGDSASESSDGLFVPVPPTRLLDTRVQRPRVWPGGTVELTHDFPSAASLVTNVTVTQPDRRGFVTAHPAGVERPNTSTVNPATLDHTLANMAISRTSTRGLAYYGLAGTDLVVDATGYFTGDPVAATLPPPPNAPGHSRVLLVGDSTLASIDVYEDSHQAFSGFDPIVDAGSCRRLLRPSCLSNTTGLIPTTAVEAILSRPAVLDIVVVKAGYNDWFSDFPGEFDAVVRAARARGAHPIVWLTYNEAVNRQPARLAYEENNVDLRHLVTLPHYSDVVLADWLTYSTPHPEWFFDGTHLRRDGTYALVDYVNRWVAAIEHKPCPRPRVPGGPISDPCPRPDALGPVPDATSLY
jgi:hypothetical protein